MNDLNYIAMEKSLVDYFCQIEDIPKIKAEKLNKKNTALSIRMKPGTRQKKRYIEIYKQR